MKTRYIVRGIIKKEKKIPSIREVSKKLKVRPENIISITPIKYSLDARHHQPKYVFDVEVITDIKVPEFNSQPKQETIKIIKKNRDTKPLIVGMGPAGLFAALYFVKSGIQPVIIERGKSIEDRNKDINEFNKIRELNIESNLVFGEGGAGTYSDGKLTSRKKNIYTEWILRQLVEFGADEDILLNTRPHIGTDILQKIIINIRKYLIKNGSKIHYETRMTDLIVKNKRVCGIKTAESEFKSDAVILATGQNTEDVYYILDKYGINILPKPTAIGVRIEHPREFIDIRNFGKYYKDYPTSGYILTYNTKDKRGVYSFCVCPGGEIVCASNAEGQLVLNGMSYSKRDSDFTNGGIVVGIREEELGNNFEDALKFRKDIEQKAFSINKDYSAIVQNAADFVSDRLSASLKVSSYKLGLYSYMVKDIFPAFIVDSIKQGLVNFNKKIKGFSEEGLLLAPETRTSSIVKVDRSKETAEVNGINGLYFCGEGSGHSGGIISSAMDGIKAARTVIPVQGSVAELSFVASKRTK